MTKATNGARDLAALSFDELADAVKGWKSQRLSIALCHGCFDPLHIGHVRHFAEASKLADKLIVTITSDLFVNKGNNRPYFCERDRLEMIASLKVVDACALNLWETAVPAIRQLSPDYFVKGIDYADLSNCNPNVLLEKEAIEKLGGRLVFTSAKKISSTKLIEEGHFAERNAINNG